MNEPVIQGVPALCDFWDLEKIVLCEIRTSWVVHRLVDR